MDRRGRHRRGRPGLGRRFNLLWTGQAVSQLGDYIAYLTVPLFVLEILESTADESKLPFAFTYALEQAPVLLVGLVGGVILDRLRLRSLMVVSDILRAVVFGYLAWVASVPGREEALPVVFAASFAFGTLAAMFGSALYAFIPALVGPARLAQANGRIAAAQQVMVALGPVLAGVIVGLTTDPFRLSLAGRQLVVDGFSLAFLLNAFTFVVSSITLLAIGPVQRASKAVKTGLASEAMAGFRHLWAERRLRSSTLSAAVVNLGTGFIEATFVVLAADLLGATAEWQIGVLLAGLGIGGTVGALVAPATSRRIGLGRTLIAGLLVFGGTFLAGLSLEFGIPTLVLFAMAFLGLAHVNVALVTIRQAYTPEQMLGRVTAAARAIGWITLPVGALAGAALADVIGFWPVAVGASLLPVVTAGALVFSSMWRDAFGPSYDTMEATDGASTGGT